MQTNKQASILIWVFFLTLLMSFSFMFIQFQIKNSLQANSKKLDFLEKEKQIQEFLGDINSKSAKIGEDNIEIKDFSSLEYSLKKDETLELNFTETGSVDLELLNSGIITYATGTSELGKNILPTYNTGITFVSFDIIPPENLKIKNLSGYAKIKIGASKKFEYPLSSLPKTIKFEKAGKMTLSIGKKGGKISYSINGGAPKTLTGKSTIDYITTSFFIKSGDSLEFISILNPSNNKKVIIYGDYNMSNILKNNSYKIYKKTWGKEIVLESGKIKN